MHLDGEVITAEDWQRVPRRTAFLDADAVERDRQRMQRLADLAFLPVHVWERYIPRCTRSGAVLVGKFARRDYAIMMFGIMPSGEKTTVVLTGIEPWFLVRVPADSSVPEARARIEALLEDALPLGISESESDGAQSWGDRGTWMRCHFHSSTRRAKALRALEGWTTAHDDSNSYYRVVARDADLNLTGWMQLSGYTHERGWNARSSTGNPLFTTRHVITVTLAGVSSWRGDVSARADLARDRTMECAFDIETYDHRPDLAAGDIPQPEREGFDMFMISLAFITHDGALSHADRDPGAEGYPWTRPAGHAAYYCITTALVPALPGRCVVRCRDASEMLFMMSWIWHCMEPDYAVSFNGDQYDWRCIAETARTLGMLERMERNMSLARLEAWRTVENGDARWIAPGAALTHEPRARDLTSRARGYEGWHVNLIKLSAEITVPTAALVFPGYCNIDMMQQLRVAFRNPDRYSLNFFLKQLKLGLKIDMPYEDMFAAYRESCAIRAALALTTTAPAAVAAAAALAGMTERVAACERTMLRVGEYCVIDSVRCHDLMVNVSYIREKREVGTLTACTMDDCIYRANGMKVRNVVVARATRRGVQMSNRAQTDVEDGKYPGAYVIAPTKGVIEPRCSPGELRASGAWDSMSEADYAGVLGACAAHGVWPEDWPASARTALPHLAREWLAGRTVASAAASTVTSAAAVSSAAGSTGTQYPLSALDFASLYPSEIMARNFSPECMIHTVEQALACDLPVYKVEFAMNGRTVRAWSVQHRYAACEADIRAQEARTRAATAAARAAYTVLADDSTAEARAEARALWAESLAQRDATERMLVAARFGVLPSVQRELIVLRAAVKSEMVPIKKRIEQLKMLTQSEFESERVAAEWSELQFRFNGLRTKEQALKVLMNTFYGELGNARSAIYVLAIAGGITLSGRNHLRGARAVLERLHCRVYYGDTDSLYFTMPRAVYGAADRAWYGSGAHGLEARRDYARAMVTATFASIDSMRDAVNCWLVEDTGGAFLRMAYEEVLFPAALFSKKKYVGIAHVQDFIAHPKEIFVRGLEYVKKSASELLSDVSQSVLWTVLAWDNTRTIIDIVEAKLREIYTGGTIDPAKFERSATYKPQKKNASVNEFAERMRAIGLAPAALERFVYIVARKYPFAFDVRGRKRALRVGERMEYAARAREIGLEPDLSYYMGSAIAGQLARFIACDARFAVAPVRLPATASDAARDSAVEDAEERTTALARKHIDACCREWDRGFMSKGPALSVLYKRVSTVFYREWSGIAHAGAIWRTDTGSAPLMQLLTERAERQAATDAERDATRVTGALRARNIVGWIAHRNAYARVCEQRAAICGAMRRAAEAALSAVSERAEAVFRKRDAVLEACTHALHGTVGVHTDQITTLEPIIARIAALNEAVLRRDVCSGIGQIVTVADLHTVDMVERAWSHLVSVRRVCMVATLVHDQLNIYIRYKLGDTTHIYQRARTDDLDAWLDTNDAPDASALEVL